MTNWSLFCPSWRIIAACWKKKNKLWNHTLMHTSRTFLGTKKAISDNLGKIILGGIITVPLKSKFTLNPRNSRLEPRILKLKHFKFPDVRIKSQVLSSEVREARFLCEIIIVQSHSRLEICTVDQCLRFSVLY